MSRKFAISDIHGCAKTFIELLTGIAFSKSDELYLLGNSIDRGPDSKAVLDQIFQMKKGGYEVHCLLGNHEEMFLEAFRGAFGKEAWLSHGGKDTLRSFDAKTVHEIPLKYCDFICDMGLYLEVDQYILVHAGLDFQSKNDPFGNEKTLLRTRNTPSNINYDWLGDRIIVHGHTPCTTSTILDLIKNIEQKRCLEIDAGCVYHEKAALGFGHLCAYDMTNRVAHFQENIDKVG